jgi:outer membrane receptor for ferrienterochelin and colicins
VSNVRQHPYYNGPKLKLRNQFKIVPLILSIAHATLFFTWPDEAKCQENPNQSEDSNSDTLSELFELPFEEIAEKQIRVTTPTRFEQKVSDAPATIYIITPQMIREYGANTLGEVIERSPGTIFFGTYTYRNNQISFRGDAASHTNTHVLFLVDGRPFRDSLYGGLAVPLLDAFPLERIQRIEIIQGPGSVLYGTNAYIGVINIITKEAQDQETIFGFSTGSFNTQRGYLSTKLNLGKLQLTLGSNLLISQGWISNHHIMGPTNLTEANYVHKVPMSINDKSIDFKLRYKDLRFRTYVGNTIERETFSRSSNYSTRPYIATNTFPEIYYDMLRIQSDLEFKHQFNDFNTMTANLTYNGGRFPQLLDQQAADIREYGKSDDLLLELADYLNFSKDFKMLVGGLGNLQSGYLIDRSRRSDGSEYDLYNPAQIPNSDPYPSIPFYKEIWFSQYSEAAYSLSEKIGFTAGYQLNKPSNSGLDIVPRISFNYEFLPDWRFKLLYGQAFRSPTFFEQRFNVFTQSALILGNTSLGPEKITTYESILSFEKPHWSGSLSVFYSQQHDVIGRLVNQTLPDGRTNVQLYSHLGGLDSFGTTLATEAKISERFATFGSFAWSRTHSDQGRWDVFGLPPVVAKIGGSYRWAESITLALTNTYFSPGTDYQPVFRIEPPVGAANYSTLQMTANLDKLFKSPKSLNQSIYLFVTNLFDADVRYPEYNLRLTPSFPGRAGRAFYLGYQLSL